MYSSPTLTPVADFRSATNGGGKAKEKDLLGFSALIVIHWPWS